MARRDSTRKTGNRSQQVLSKQEISTFLRKMYRVFEQDAHKFQLVKMESGKHGEYAAYDHKDGTKELEYIKIDYRKEFIPTLIHEIIHFLHMDKSETWVIQREKLVMASLSERQIKNILKKFGSHI